MSFFRYLSGLLLVIGLVGSLQALLLQHVYFQGNSRLVWWATLFFTAFSIVLFYTSRKAAIHENPYYFMYVSYSAILIKLACSITIVWWYTRAYQPQRNYYVLQFILVYIIFTVYETYFMSRLGRARPQKS